MSNVWWSPSGSNRVLSRNGELETNVIMLVSSLALAVAERLSVRGEVSVGVCSRTQFRCGSHKTEGPRQKATDTQLEMKVELCIWWSPIGVEAGPVAKRRASWKRRHCAQNGRSMTEAYRHPAHTPSNTHHRQHTHRTNTRHRHAHTHTQYTDARTHHTTHTQPHTPPVTRRKACGKEQDVHARDGSCVLSPHL